ncbi:MAG: hypothetical protein ACFB4J_09630 [Elainellaceae cyanobacterium]
MTTRRDTSIQTSLFVKGWQAIAYSRLWSMVLLGAGVASSLIFAHAPLPAFATASGMTLPRRRAFVVVVAIWGINQALGFTLRGYPLEPTAIAWGFVMGIGALLAVNLSSRRLDPLRWTWTGYWFWAAIAFFGSVAVYQGLIALVFPLLAQGHSMGWEILGRLIMKQAVWAAGILSCHALWLKGALYRAQKSRQ